MSEAYTRMSCLINVLFALSFRNSRRLRATIVRVHVSEEGH